MGLQLSILVGCVGAIELLACLKHVFVCVLKLTDQPSNCCIDYFHRSRISDDFVIVDKSNLENNNKQACSEIEAILRETRSEPDILCLGPPIVDGYVRIPTPIPFGIDGDVADEKSSSKASSLVDSGNENPTTRKSIENLTVTAKRYNGSSSDVSSLEDTENVIKSTSKKLFRRSRTPEIHGDSYDDYDDGEEEENGDKLKKPKSSKSPSTLSVRRLTKSKSKASELGRSAENLSTIRRSKRHREPERCKSDIQIQVARNLLRDEWTNTSPVDSNGNLSKTSSKKSISVLIQTSFEDKLQNVKNNSVQNVDIASKLNSCPNCCCSDNCPDETRVRRITEISSVDGKPQLLKISSFEEASGEDYEKFKNIIGAGDSTVKRGKPNNWSEKIKSSIDSESYDEYVDADEEGVTFSEHPIQYTIPDSGDTQAFWVI